MDFKQLLPLLLKGKLGEKEQALLKLTENPSTTDLTSLISHMYEKKPSRPDVYAMFKKIIPAKTLGQIIKYFDAKKMRGNA